MPARLPGAGGPARGAPSSPPSIHRAAGRPLPPMRSKVRGTDLGDRGTDLSPHRPAPVWGAARHPRRGPPSVGVEHWGDSTPHPPTPTQSPRGHRRPRPGPGQLLREGGGGRWSLPRPRRPPPGSPGPPRPPPPCQPRRAMASSARRPGNGADAAPAPQPPAPAAPRAPGPAPPPGPGPTAPRKGEAAPAPPPPREGGGGNVAARTGGPREVGNPGEVSPAPRCGAVVRSPVGYGGYRSHPEARPGLGGGSAAARERPGGRYRERELQHPQAQCRRQRPKPRSRSRCGSGAPGSRSLAESLPRCGNPGITRYRRGIPRGGTRAASRPSFPTPLPRIDPEPPHYLLTETPTPKSLNPGSSRWWLHGGGTGKERGGRGGVSPA